MYNQSWLHQYATLIKWWKVNRAKQSAVEKMGSSLSKKIWRSSNFYTFVGLSSTTSRLNGEYLQNEDDTIGLSVLELQGVSYIISKSDELWSTNSV